MMFFDNVKNTCDICLICCVLFNPVMIAFCFKCLKGDHAYEYILLKKKTIIKNTSLLV